MSASTVAVARPAASGSRSLGRWVARAGVAVADQALSSGATLVLGIVLARWLAPEALGAFALGTSLLLLASTVHNSLVLEPMSVLGPGRHAHELAAYMRAQTSITLAVALPIAAVMVVAGGVAWSAGARIGEALAGAGIAMPLVLVQWVARRRRYIEGRPAAALAGSAVLVGGVVAGIIVLAITGWHTPLPGFVVLGGASAASAISMRAPRGGEAIDRRSMLAEQWRYGRWLVGTSAISVAGTQSQLMLAAAMLGLGAAGQLRAMHILILPMSQAITAMSTLALPSMAYDVGAGAPGRAHRTGRGVGAALLGIALVFEAGLLLAGDIAGKLLYGTKYASVAAIVPVLGLVPIMQSLAVGPSLVLRAAQRPAHYLITGAATGVVGVTTAALLPARFGVAGAAWSMVAAYAASAIAATALARVWLPVKSAAHG